MSTSSKRQTAEQHYLSGRELYQNGLYNEALIDLRRAEDAFRKLDARGHPFFPNPLSNGLSGLANSLVLLGHCCRKLGNYRAALIYYETSFINAKFEKKKAFRTFTASLAGDMIDCYAKILEELGGGERERLLSRETEIDTSFRFPYSLAPDVIPVARLYELAPDRYAGYGDFYRRARERDAGIRRQTKTTDESVMKRMSIYVWGILLTIWAIYGFIVVRALTGGK